MKLVDGRHHREAVVLRYIDIMFNNALGFAGR
jgi:hypothetical protein